MTTIRSVIENHREVSDFGNAVIKLSEKVIQKDPNTFEAPGPAEAWAWLMTFVDTPGAVMDDPRSRSRAIYRGQSNANWDLKPELLRLNNDERSDAIKMAKHFSSIVQIEFETLWKADTIVNWPPLHERSGEAAARHFGMKTSLLDWSSYYSIALDFATRKADGQLAAIWWIYLSDADKTNLRLVLPPPYIHRLYLQKGLFTEIEDPKSLNELNKYTKKIIFPALHHESVKVLNYGKMEELSSLETPVPWFDALYKYCNSENGKMAYKQSGNDIESALRFESFLQKQEEYPEKPWNYVIQDLGVSTWFGEDGMLREIPAFILSLAQRNGKFGQVGLDGDVLRILKRDDPDMLDWVLRIIRDI